MTPAGSEPLSTPGGGRPVGGRDGPPPAAPPADAEEWDDDQWIAWLEATDPEGEPSDERDVAAPRVVRHGGQVLGQAMLGMARAIYGQEEDDIVVVAEGPADPGPDDGFTVRLDPDHPDRSSVVFRRPGGRPGAP